MTPFCIYTPKDQEQILKKVFAHRAHNSVAYSSQMQATAQGLLTDDHAQMSAWRERGVYTPGHMALPLKKSKFEWFVGKGMRPEAPMYSEMNRTHELKHHSISQSTEIIIGRKSGMKDR